VNFVMAPAVKVAGRLVGYGRKPTLPPHAFRRKEIKVDWHDAAGAPLAGWRVWLVGGELPPASSVLASTDTDAEGRFEFGEVPVGFEWQLQTETSKEQREPQSIPFRFKRPEIRHFELELRADEKTLRIR
jgi:hypothetical protein